MRLWKRACGHGYSKTLPNPRPDLPIPTSRLTYPKPWHAYPYESLIQKKSDYQLREGLEKKSYLIYLNNVSCSINMIAQPLSLFLQNEIYYLSYRGITGWVGLAQVIFEYRTWFAESMSIRLKTRLIQDSFDW